MRKNRPLIFRRVSLFSAAIVAGSLAGCGETPDPGASRAAPVDATTDAATGSDVDAGLATEGGSRSTLGRARDRAESVIKDMEEYDQRRMDLIDEMNGKEPSRDVPGDGDGEDEPDGGR